MYVRTALPAGLSAGLLAILLAVPLAGCSSGPPPEERYVKGWSETWPGRGPVRSDDEWLRAAAADVRANTAAADDVPLHLVWAGHSQERKGPKGRMRSAVFFADTDAGPVPFQVTELVGGDGFYSEARQLPTGGSPADGNPAMVSVDVDRPHPDVEATLLVADDVDRVSWTPPGGDTLPVPVRQGLARVVSDGAVDSAYECSASLLYFVRDDSPSPSYAALVDQAPYLLADPPYGQLDDAAVPFSTTIATGCGRPSAGMVLAHDLGTDLTVKPLADKPIRLRDGTSGTPYSVQSTVDEQGRTRVLWVPEGDGKPVLSAAAADHDTSGERAAGVPLTVPDGPTLLIGLGGHVTTDPVRPELAHTDRLRVFEAGTGPTVMTVYENGVPIGTNLVEAP